MIMSMRAFLFSTLVLCSAVQFSTVTKAEESMSDVATNAAFKDAVIKAYKQMISSHEQLKIEEIHKDLQNRLDARIHQLNEIAQSNSEQAKKAETASQIAKDVVVKELKKLTKINDKETLILVEKGALQEVQSSDNYLFILTRQWDEFLSPVHYIGPFIKVRMKRHPLVVVGMSFMFILTVPADLVLLPISFAATAAIGF